MKIKNFLIGLFVISIILYYVDYTRTIKFFQYFLPALSIVFLLNKWLYKTRNSENEISSLLYIYTCLIAVNSLVMFDGFYMKFIQESYLFLGSLLFCVCVIAFSGNNLDKIFNTLLYTIILTFVLEKGPEIIVVLQNPSALVMGVISSNVPSESSLSFYFAIMALYYVFKKEKFKYTIAIIFMILSFKRIALTGFICALSLYFVFTYFKISFKRKLLSIIASSLNFLYLGVLVLLINGDFDETIYDIFGVSSNFLFMGRIDTYQNVISELGSYSLIGNGMGKVSDTLIGFQTVSYIESSLTNLHSDIFKYYLEFGLILFPIFIFSFYYHLSKNINSYSMCVALNIILLTDNVSIYFTFMILYYLIIFGLNHPGNKFIISKHNFDTSEKSNMPILI